MIHNKFVIYNNTYDYFQYKILLKKKFKTNYYDILFQICTL